MKKALDYKAMAIECLGALRLMNQHYDDLSKSNPGFLGRLVLQRYDVMNTAFMAMTAALRRYGEVKT